MEDNSRKERCGYLTNSGYVGMVNGHWMLFATERDYIEYTEEEIV